MKKLFLTFFVFAVIVISVCPQDESISLMQLDLDYWKSLSPDAKKSFVQGFVLGVSLEKYNTLLEYNLDTGGFPVSINEDALIASMDKVSSNSRGSIKLFYPFGALFSNVAEKITKELSGSETKTDQAIVDATELRFSDELIGKNIVLENAYLSIEFQRLDYSSKYSNASQLEEKSNGKLSNLYLLQIYDSRGQLLTQPYDLSIGPIPAAVTSKSIVRQWEKLCRTFNMPNSVTKKAKPGGSIMEVSIYDASFLLFIIDSIEVIDSNGATIVLK